MEGILISIYQIPYENENLPLLTSNVKTHLFYNPRIHFINHIFTISFFHAILELTNDSTYLYCIFKDEKKKKIHKELKETKENSQFAITWNNIAINVFSQASSHDLILNE